MDTVKFVALKMFLLSQRHHPSERALFHIASAVTNMG